MHATSGNDRYPLDPAQRRVPNHCVLSAIGSFQPISASLDGTTDKEYQGPAKKPKHLRQSSLSATQFTFPTSLISYTRGTMPIAVADSSSSVKGANTVMLPIVNPAPYLSLCVNFVLSGHNSAALVHSHYLDDLAATHGSKSLR